MKKISMLLFAVVLMLSFAACNSAKKTDEGEKALVIETIEPVVPVEPNPTEALKAFQAYAKEYGEAFNNLLKDPQKYTTLAGQVQRKVADMERIKVDLTPDQIKDYEKALKIIMDVNSGGKK